MKLDVKFTELTNSFETVFGEVHNISDGGFERGYAEGETKGYEKGYTEGEVKGFANGETVGYNKGYAEGELVSYDKGHADGVKSEYDRFWDEFQQNGTRTNYQQVFRLWTEEIFKPKYDIKPTGTYGGAQMFQASPIKDLKGCFERARVKLDTSECTSLIQMFQASSIQYIPAIDARKSTNNGYTFSSGNIISIEKFISSETTRYLSTTFDCASMETIIFEGIIADDGFRFSNCKKLSHDSLMSIINILKDYSGTGTTRTCTLGEANLAKLTDAEKAIATEKGWSLA